jgi:hypothetical protein
MTNSILCACLDPHDSKMHWNTCPILTTIALSTNVLAVQMLALTSSHLCDTDIFNFEPGFPLNCLQPVGGAAAQAWQATEASNLLNPRTTGKCYTIEKLERLFDGTSKLKDSLSTTHGICFLKPPVPDPQNKQSVHTLSCGHDEGV